MFGTCGSGYRSMALSEEKDAAFLSDMGLCAGPFHSKGPARPLSGRTRLAPSADQFRPSGPDPGGGRVELLGVASKFRLKTATPG
jgi:hypothetical protein